MLTQQKATACRLCEHIKDDGARCGSPAKRRQKYCHRHLQLRRRGARMERAGFLADRNTEQRRKRAARSVKLLQRVLKSSWIKKMLSNSFAENNLEDLIGKLQRLQQFAKGGGGGRGLVVTKAQHSNRPHDKGLPFRRR